jgi:hypothetical protein
LYFHSNFSKKFCANVVKALNQARLEASVRAYGGEKVLNTWPSLYIILCMILLVASLFKMLYHPLRWFAVGAAAAGLPPILIRSVVAIRRLTLDINILMVIAGTGTFFFFFLEVIGGHANFQNQQQYLHANLFFF